jgi:hypothetical protein
MSQEEKNQKKIQELESAKTKLSGLIEKLQENPSLSDDEIAGIAGGVLPGGGEETINGSGCINNSCG